MRPPPPASTPPGARRPSSSRCAGPGWVDAPAQRRRTLPRPRRPHRRPGHVRARVAGARLEHPHLQLHLDVHPPIQAPMPFRFNWHQDGGRQNREIETTPRPRLSVKIAYWPSNVSQPGRGNLKLVPGSHKEQGFFDPATHRSGLEASPAWPSGQTSVRTSHRSIIAPSARCVLPPAGDSPITADALLRVPEPGNLRAAIASVDWTLSRA